MEIAEDRRSRFAELAVELIGAQAARDFMQKIWETSSEAVRAELADAILGRLRPMVEKAASWTFEEAIKRVAQELAIKTFEPYHDRFVALVRGRIEAKLDDFVQAAVNTVLDGAKNAAIAKVITTLREQVRY